MQYGCSNHTMKYIHPPKKAPKFRYDFEVGYLVKSPCKGCETRPRFPKCISSCKLLDMLHTRMVDTVSCARKG